MNVSSSSTPISQKSATTYSTPWTAILLSSLLLGSVGGALTYGAISLTKNPSSLSSLNARLGEGKTMQINVSNEDSQITNVARSSVDSVVSIVASKSVNYNSGRGSLFDQLFGTDSYSTPQQEQNKPVKRQISAGTGFLISSDGYMITNKHVVEDKSANYTAIFNNGSEVPVTVIDRDTVLDIAFLKVEKQTFDLKPLPLGTSESLKVGQTAIAIGNSLGEFSNTVSKGIVSGLNRSIQAGDSTGQTVENLDNIIQTDASINSGNSGGPLLDLAGNVIGINVAKAQSGENIGFAIPIDMVKPILDSIIKNGKIIRPYIGVRYMDVTPALAKARGLTKDYGALLEGNQDTPAVLPDSPAAKAGLQAGDQILSINQEQLSPSKSLRTIINKYSAGTVVTLKIITNGTEKEVQLTLANTPK